ncbi:MAG TPA: tetratricopeptide repeat protein, partial [Acidimicrobiales bacterium]|nr:tetratricopeptide repeat protein [Acidimicrobiales bacterium]
LGATGLVAGVVAAALDAPQVPGGDPMASLVRHLRLRRILLVLDNCEHVVEECAEVADRLLVSCPDVKVVATSREVVGLPGEQVYRLEGLDAVHKGPGSTSDAVDLFVQRARAATADWSPSAAELTLAEEICQRLDGLPLAIELAAARAVVLGLPEVAARLEGDPRLLRHPNRRAPVRHQTLEATLDWSYRLLDPAEQRLFARLAVFRGTFSLLAAETVTAGGEIDRKDVVSLLGGLVDRSLVQVADRGPEHRYRLLQIVRNHARARLADSGDAAAVERAHAEFFLALAAQAHAGLDGPDQVRWLQRLELEHDNLRAVLRRQLPDAPEVGGRLAAALWPFWYRHGYYHEARAWLEETAALAAAMSAGVAADVLTGAGTLAFLQCDYQLAEERLERAMVLHRESGQQVGVATVLQRLGTVARERAHYDDARRLHESSRQLWVELGDDAGVAASDDYLGFVAWLQGDAAAALDSCTRALRYFEGAGRPQEAAAALINVAVATAQAGDRAQAEHLLQRALDDARRIGYSEGVAWATHELGTIRSIDDPSVPALLCESLTVHADLGDRWRAASVLETIAARLLGEPEPDLATRLLAASDALRRRVGAPVPPAERPPVDAALEGLRGRLGSGAFAAAWEAGATLAFADAVEMAARACQPGPPPAEESAVGAPTDAGAEGIRTRRPLPYELTEREVAVLRLVSEGLTNKEIAARLFISSGTAGVHVSNILRKLGVSSRVKAAGLARDLGLDAASSV